MNFSYSELENLFDVIKEIINDFENSRYYSRVQQIYLGNGDKIKFSIPRQHVAHLLGIDTNALVSTGRFKSKDSFGVLKEMCENAYTIYKMKQEGIISYENLFSNFILNKVENFKRNININLNDIELACKYNSNKTYTSSDKFEKYDYIIVKRYEDGKIGILCIVNNGNGYVPMSSQTFNDFETAKGTLEKYLKYQEITLANGLEQSNEEIDYSNPFHLSINSKIEKLYNLLNYKELFESCIDISKDYEYVLNKLRNNKSNYISDNYLIDSIVESIKSGKLIDIELFRDTSLIKIIESFNDYLCRTQATQDDSIGASYTEMKQNLEKAKRECEKLQSLNKILLNEKSSLSDEVSKLKSENSEYQEREQKVLEILKSPRN